MSSPAGISGCEWGGFAIASSALTQQTLGKTRMRGAIGAQ
jgi:hypothetical protein